MNREGKIQISEFYRDKILAPAAQKSYRGQWHELVLLNKAYALMLKRSGYLDEKQCGLIMQGLDRVEKNMTGESIKGETEDVFFALQEGLYREIGQETGGLLHTGRSRNDIFAATGRMEVRKSIWRIGEMLIRLMEKLLEEAGRSKSEPFIYYTFGQPSQPGKLGHYYLYLFQGFARDFRRLRHAYGNTNRCPMGAAAGIGTSFDVDRELMCGLLGFDEVIVNTLEAVSSCDYILETQMAVSLLMGNVSRVLTDLYTWCSWESGLWDCSYGICAGSSIMPQKKNPAAVEYARSRAAHTAGNLIDMTILYQKSSPFPNIDNMELLYNYEEGMEQAAQALGELTEILYNSEPRRGMIARNMEESLIGATALAEHLSQKFDIPFTKGHDIVTGMVRALAQRGRISQAAMTSELMREISEQVLGAARWIDDDEIRKTLDARSCTDNIITEGAPTEAQIDKMLESGKGELARCQAWLEESMARVENAYAAIIN